MAINIRKRKLGCAHYNPSTSTLHLMEDIEESPPYDIVNLCKRFLSKKNYHHFRHFIFSSLPNIIKYYFIILYY